MWRLPHLTIAADEDPESLIEGVRATTRERGPRVMVLAIAALVATLGPTSQVAALRWLRPHTWVALPAGALLAYLLLLIGGRLPNVFIYFQF